ncbi:monooxygenase FAD-binding protein [Novosphingobium sp. Rr 2-17]|uniref:bifunctional 3-(3-hydroxy-phenyl)propionate/3-hydroxycinnamic acid hydroxylase MhpA n=1 Tax=Novosphingobium sp. Rr 2-17 TaxID=555793 RepID=UPI000269A1D3|nr:bifunctional 3-(3-hydroxy-phenyl)propionate/3-hydroxycinnamic acid hydroxylase [Novosphingobium sp. Rr 2-17]EIZ79723.1 monooxygenase FAD-binding protein [Novosphingobium sp. Rr 2-17]
MLNVYDVVIAGCGPTGLTTALLLARAGHSVAIIDRHETIYPLPRAIAFDHEIARVLNRLGLTETLRPLVATPGVYQWRNRHGETLFELDWTSGGSVSGFANSYLFSQPDLERVLNETAAVEPNLTILRGFEVTGVTQTEDLVTLSGIKNGETVDVVGKWLVGADGANSLVRASMGLELEDLGFEADWLVVDVKPKEGGTLPFDDTLMLQVCDPARPTTVVSGGPGRRRWEFMALEGETLADLNSPERAWALLAAWDLTPDNAVLERHAIYTFRGAIARKWRDRRVFIAGDAAHLTPPFAAQGFCAGLRDAAALSWRLDLALKGLAGDLLLDTYESERAPHARAWVFNAIELGKIICVLDPAAAEARDAGMRAAREAGAPPPSDEILPSLGKGAHWDDHGGGTLAVGGLVERAIGQGHFDDVVGTGFVLLSRSGDPAEALSEENAALFASLGGITADVAAATDVSGAYTAWFEKLDADTALVRPDFYVFGAASGPDAANELVSALGTFLNPQE